MLTYLFTINSLQVPLALRRTKIKQEIDKDNKAKTKESKEETPVRGRRKAPKSYVDDDPDLDDMPLKSIKKEREPKPEEMVSMEKYYFGQIGGKETAERVAISVVVSLCHTK